MVCKYCILFTYTLSFRLHNTNLSYVISSSLSECHNVEICPHEGLLFINYKLIEIHDIIFSLLKYTITVQQN